MNCYCFLSLAHSSANMQRDDFKEVFMSCRLLSLACCSVTKFIDKSIISACVLLPHIIGMLICDRNRENPKFRSQNVAASYHWQVLRQLVSIPLRKPPFIKLLPRIISMSFAILQCLKTCLSAKTVAASYHKRILHQHYNDVHPLIYLQSG